MMIPVNLLPEEYRKQCCVAGGWAACPALAGDQDVWVYGVPTDYLESTRAFLLWHLELQRNGRPRGPYFEARRDTREVKGYDHPRNVRKVAEVFVSHPAKRIHLMVTDAMAAGEIVAGFDVSTHAVAVDFDGRIYTAEGFTPPHEPPVRLRDIDTTTARMTKIAARFGHPVEEVEVG